jgi:predicted RNA binding protein YcfA (HicA-like mRNA interferase family)
MSKRQKRLQKLRQNPKDVSFDDLKQVLEDFGFEHVRTVGSHHTFIAQHGEKDWRLTIPFHRPVKQAYVVMALAAIDEIIAMKYEEEQADDDPNNEDAG